MSYRSPADYRFRAYVWRGLTLLGIAIWLSIFICLGGTTVNVVREALYVRHPACNGLTADECTALLETR